LFDAKHPCFEHVQTMLSFLDSLTDPEKDSQQFDEVVSLIAHYCKPKNDLEIDTISSNSNAS
jgi:hypothetical protein